LFVADLDAEIDTVKSSLTHLEKSHEKKELQQAEDSLGIAKQQKAVERYLMKRQLLLSRKDDCNKNIRDLGVLPEEAFGENTASSDKLLKKLRKINEALKVFAHVNKKAYE
jgi:structural maintenance of chromosome 3 (chondroitin sulfate proteoglycan 6)